MAAVNGAGRGEWTETTVGAAIIETLSIEGLGESRQLHTYRFIMMHFLKRNCGQHQIL